MAERVKMAREERAKQFAPFDALKGLQNALRAKEYEHERIAKGDITEEKAIELSKTLLSIEKGDVVEARVFKDGHIESVSGKCTIDFIERELRVNALKIQFDCLLDLRIIEK